MLLFELECLHIKFSLILCVNKDITVIQHSFLNFKTHGNQCASTDLQNKKVRLLMYHSVYTLFYFLSNTERRAHRTTQVRKSGVLEFKQYKLKLFITYDLSNRDKNECNKREETILVLFDSLN